MCLRWLGLRVLVRCLWRGLLFCVDVCWFVVWWLSCVVRVCSAFSSWYSFAVRCVGACGVIVLCVAAVATMTIGLIDFVGPATIKQEATHLQTNHLGSLSFSLCIGCR